MSDRAPFASLRQGLEPGALGRDLHAWITELFPLCRSITGDGLRQTLASIAERIPLEIHEVATGTKVLDWEVPNEWTVREAWIKGPDGETIVDVADHTLHLLGYSSPVSTELSRAALDEHLFSLPEQPDLIPYRTSYFRETWGFCLPHRQREALPEGQYEVCIDTDLAPGSLTYGELVLPGDSEREIVLSAHACHPSLANDNLSGLAVATAVAQLLSGAARRYTYRIVFAPGTIGAITWLAENRDRIDRVHAVVILACLGDSGAFHYKRSRRGDTELDRAVAHVFATSGEPDTVREFEPFGYDERQYGSPGFDLAAGLFTRTPWGEFPEYHTSADSLDLVTPEALAGSVARLLEILEVLEGNARYENLSPYGEPQLGRRGLYSTIGGGDDGRQRQLALLWVLNQSDGGADLLAIAEKSGLGFEEVRGAADALEGAGLLRRIGG